MFLTMVTASAAALLHAQLYTVYSLSTDLYCKRCVLGNNIFCPSHITILDNLKLLDPSMQKKREKEGLLKIFFDCIEQNFGS